jgi:RNA polymerase sigma factor, sigma-70 family
LERRIFSRAAGLLLRLWTAAAAAVSPEAEDGEPDGFSPESREALNRRAEDLMDRYGNSVLRIAYSYLHNTADAEEVLQDTLIRFLKSAPAFESPSHEKAWLLRVAGNLSKNRIDYNRVRCADELNEELASEEREDLSFVWEAVKALPVKYREAVHLFYAEGCSTAEIAEILHENEATVRSRLMRGRSRLKEVLKEAYDFG